MIIQVLKEKQELHSLGCYDHKLGLRATVTLGCSLGCHYVLHLLASLSDW